MKEFFGRIYDIGLHPYSDRFYNDLIHPENGFVTTTVIYTGIAILVILSLFYFIPRPKYGTLKYWLISVLLIGITSFIIGYATGNNSIIDIYDGMPNYKYGDDLLLYGVINGFFAMIFSLIFSAGLKNLSTHSKHVPF